MWLSRTNSKTRIPRNPSSSSDFSCSSFKDILSLCADEPTSGNPTRFKKSNIFHRVLRANAVLRALSGHLPPKPGPDPYASLVPPAKASPICLPGSETRIVVYITSLRVVRRTFEDCKDVLAILRSFRVSIDERDLSMDPRFLDELKAILGIREKRKLTLPRVFIGGRYVGGADEIRQLHEAGELKKCAEGLPPANPATCEVCYGHRFTLCRDCNGSRKYYSEKSGFRICTACNENGLIRCSSCSG